eukprot:COSAG01_NODE_5182_length_4426_cov_299.396580_2_plen_34_part_00
MQLLNEYMEVALGVSQILMSFGHIAHTHTRERK